MPPRQAPLSASHQLPDRMPVGAWVAAGVTYRPFHSQQFGEIAFCAVSANEQVKGFGTRLMNYTKVRRPVGTHAA